MSARDYIDEIMSNNDNLNSLFEILENSMIELDRNTSNSRDRNKILKSLGQFNIILKTMILENKEIYKKCNAMWDIVIQLEK